MEKISPERNFNGNHAFFFYFMAWCSWIFLIISLVLTDILLGRSKNLGWYLWNLTKKKFKTLRHPDSSRALHFALRSDLRSPPLTHRGAWEVLIYFFVRFHDPDQGFHFSSEINSRGIFPDMSNEYVWEKYFMVSRSHQTFFFHMSGKNLDTMGVPGGWYIAQTCSSNFEKIYPPKGKAVPSQSCRNVRSFSPNGEGVQFSILENL